MTKTAAILVDFFSFRVERWRFDFELWPGDMVFHSLQTHIIFRCLTHNVLKHLALVKKEESMYNYQLLTLVISVAILHYLESFYVFSRDDDLRWCGKDIINIHTKDWFLDTLSSVSCTLTNGDSELWTVIDHFLNVSDHEYMNSVVLIPTPWRRIKEYRETERQFNMAIPLLHYWLFLRCHKVLVVVVYLLLRFWSFA